MQKKLDSKKSEDILFSIEQNIGFIELNRPKALNALHPTMMASIHQHLKLWAENDDIHAIVIHSNSKRAFCAGGDLRAVYNAGIQGHLDYLDFLFREEYLLNVVIDDLRKPYISFVDGVAMGGGVGLIAHGSHCILSEKVLLAMPETNIGFFPDVGASRFLNRAPKNIGLYLALTGNVIDAGDALYAQIGTHYVPHSKQPELFKKLKDLDYKTHDSIDKLIEYHAEPLPKNSLQQIENEINELFGAKTLVGVFENLEKSSSDFAKKTLDILKKRSPTSLAVTFEQFKRGKTMDELSDIMSMEFDLSQNFVKRNDFFEGIRATIIDKDSKPKWSPENIKDITQEYVEAHFVKQRVPLI